MERQAIQSAVATLLYEDSNYNIGPVITLQDGSLLTTMNATKKYIKQLDRALSSHYVLGRQSYDNGLTWSDPRTLVSYPRQRGWIAGTHLLQSRDGSLHIFSLRVVAYHWENSDFQGDILHTRMDDCCGTNTVTQKIACLDRYSGSINSVLQTASGAVVVPFSTFVRNEERGNWYFVCNTVYSDDNGETWNVSNDIAVIDGESHLESGAMEPVIVEWEDDRLLMLIRTTLGRFYYTLSADRGASWSEAAPTGMLSSNSPTSLVRLRDGRLLKIWNHCDGYPLHTVISYARQALHAAISADNGVTWHGYREIVVRRPDDPANTHICYPFPTVVESGDVIVKYFTVLSKDGETWNEPYAKLVRFSPAFLSETTLTETFAGGLAAWTTAGSEPVAAAWDGGTTCMMMDARDGEASVCALNFPYGSAGSLKLAYRTEGMLARARVVLSERYLDPYHFASDAADVAAIRETILRSCTVIGLSDTLLPDRPHAARPSAGCSNDWRELAVRWDARLRQIAVAFDGADGEPVEWRAGCGGFSYLILWLQGAAAGTEQRSQLAVARVEAESLRGGNSGISLG